MKIRNILSAIILVLVLSLTVGFSAFVSEMSISNLVAEVRLEENARITGVSVVSSSNGGMNSLDYDADSILGNVNLKSSSATVTLEVEVTNFGNTVMGIESHSGSADNLVYAVSGYQEKTSLCDTSSNCTLGSVTKFNVTISYDTYNAVTKDYEFKLDFVFKKMHSITYTDITNNNYPLYIMNGQTLSVNLGSSAPSKLDVYSDGVLLDSTMYSYVNGTLTISEVTGDIEIKKRVPVARLVSGSLNEIGSEVCIKDECFYIISNDGTKVSMLAKYNLNVGYIVEPVISGVVYNDELYNVSPLVMTSKNAYVMPLSPQGPTFEETINISPIENPSGIQDSTMIYDGTTYAGVEKFSSGSYWTTNGISLNAIYGENYPTYVYDEASLLYNYVENYKKYLNALDAPILNARLISYDELIKLGCISSCTYDWTHSTLYWTGTASNVSQVYAVGSFGIYTEAAYMSDSYNYGVRPVIEMSIDEIKLPVKPVVVSGDYDTVGSEICIDKECFYVIAGDAKTVTMLAKYNLYVGGEYNDEWISYGNKVTGLQNSAMLGWQTSGMPYKGVTAFSDSGSVQYSGSIVETYVNNYSSYLSLQGVTPIEARLITHDELIVFGFEEWATCSYNTPEWFYSTSHWTMSEYDGLSYVWVVGENSVLDIYEPDKTNFFGVRPVITISKEYF